MMWLKRKIRDWVDDADTEYSDSINMRAKGVIRSTDSVSLDDDNIPEDIDNYTLRVWRATGGRCIQYRRYDRKADRYQTELYVVSDNEDLGEAVTNIVIQQSLQGQ